jgi:hypothetical protein
MSEHARWDRPDRPISRSERGMNEWNEMQCTNECVRE